MRPFIEGIADLVNSKNTVVGQRARNLNARLTLVRYEIGDLRQRRRFFLPFVTPAEEPGRSYGVGTDSRYVPRARLPIYPSRSSAHAESKMVRRAVAFAFEVHPMWVL